MFSALNFIPAACEASETLRCHGSIISPGATRAEVRHKCGKPTEGSMRPEYFLPELSAGSRVRVDNAKITEDDLISGRVVYEEVEEWTYNFGPSRFVRTLTFRNGKLSTIESGRYGW